MAQAGSAARNRPLSPHLQIWRWGPGMLSSILHRFSGVAATVGIVLLIAWLGALVGGPALYARFAAALTSPFGYVVLVGVSWGVFAHTVTGVRHLVLDTGAGYELGENKRWATACTVLGVVLTALFWAVLLVR